METTANILKSARRLFRDQGYEHTSIEEITEMTDIAKSTFFKHFPNKESLLLGIAEEEVGDVLELLQDEKFQSENTFGKINKIMIRLLEDSIPYLELTGRVLFTTMINEATTESPFSKIRNLLGEIVQTGQEQGEITDDYSLIDIVTLLMGSYYGVLFKWLEQGNTLGSVEELERGLQLVFHGIKVYKIT
ncbi:TetR/AcrR family transcriptional regulator [Chengkuizengella axinellae]|uniref:TetR/AcrR family transcriptional regulator n=1 Tax=Chengkuizengella axinellae TaxID=3064388 RepID=A0ABT9J049_9BACL|nr:TetR/AcrR family transcriptional regulator [Chengkuizengella sp. 2205SS18-9]MDP5274990.1 TetR/AcrR family transcriptional regulator [Chengkuizengella sp. 2205SS18-9]